MNSYQSDLVKSLIVRLKETKYALDINNLLLMYQMNLISEADLKANTNYQKYVDQVLNNKNENFKKK